MKYQRFFALLCGLLLWYAALPAYADDELPTANPTMTVTGDDYVDEELTEYDGNAPMHAVFKANVENEGDYEPLYEWRFYKSDNSETPFLTRYVAETDYTFSESGSFTVELFVTFVLGTDTIEYEMDSPFAISISESVLEVPNAFTPNGDGINDVFKVKEGYQSIVKFKAMVFSRWGKKVYEWDDPAGGWDGKSGGHDCPVGAYYLNIEAKGADGRNYHIKKTINLLRNYDETNGNLTE